MMPLTLDKVHVFGRIDGTERLTGTNLYKCFQKANIEFDPEGKRIFSNPECYYAQGGRWYSAGGDEIEVEAIPEWVWVDCRSMDPHFRLMYRIILPEERAEGKGVPTVEEADEWPTKRMILEALLSLDPSNDQHWTKEGLPDLRVLRGILKVHVSRPRLDMVSPHFVRPGR